jgi:hypothetical protein
MRDRERAVQHQGNSLRFDEQVAAITSYPRYCLVAVILFGCYAPFNRGDDNAATVAPNLVFNR